MRDLAKERGVTTPGGFASPAHVGLRRYVEVDENGQLLDEQG